MAISNYSGIRFLLFEYSNNIRSPKSDQIEYTTTTLAGQPCQLNSPLNSKLTRVYNNNIYLSFTTKTKPNFNKLLSK